MASPEGQLKLLITGYLKATEPFWMRYNSGTLPKGKRFIVLHKEGTADFCIYRPGRVMWAELKVEGQRTTKSREEAQAAFAEKVRAVGHEYRIVKSLQELQEYLGGR